MKWILRLPERQPSYYMCTIEWGETRFTHEYYWGPDKKGKYRWWTSENACELNLKDGGFSDHNYKIVAWGYMPKAYEGKTYGQVRRDRQKKNREYGSGHRAAERSN